MTRVLVVEDEESFSDAISYMIRKEGFEVAVCATGPDALETFDRTVTRPPCAAVTCFTMASPSPVPPVARERAGSTR